MKYSKEQILAYTGGVQQIGGIDELSYCAGKAKGMRLYRMRTGGGLELDVLPDRCLDIARLSYRGINFNWLSKTGYSAPTYASPVVGEFDRYFSGGMLMTCGLKNTGPDYVGPDGKFRDGHGRIGMTPCEASWQRCGFDNDGYRMEIGGDTRDSLLGAHNLLLHRTISTYMGESTIVIDDRLENQEPEATDYVLLYHFNFGYPFISPSLKVEMPDAEKPIRPRTEAAEAGLDTWDLITEPIPGEEEQCFFHHLRPDADGMCRVRMENPDLGVGVILAYQAENLPILTVWKSMRAGEYVLGVEPGNSYLRGIDEERKDGTVGVIPGYGTVNLHLELRFYTLEGTR